MKNRDIVPLINGIVKLAEIEGTKFQYCLIKNRKKLFHESKSITEALQKIPESFKETEKKYTEEREVIINKYAEKGKDGNIVKDQNGKMTVKEKSIEKFLQHENQLKEKYPEYIAELKKVDEKNNVLLDEECDVNLFKIKLSGIPDGIDQIQLQSIWELIEED